MEPLNLHNDHNVYILGAGFSRDANMPLITDFLTRMRDSHPWLEEKERPDEANSVQKVLEFRSNSAAAAYWTQLDLENIEELFSLASSSSNDLNEHIQQAIAATLDYSSTLANTLPAELAIRIDSGWAEESKWLNKKNNKNEFNVKRYNYYCARLLGMFDNGRMTGQNSFITFNYDTILEEAIHCLGSKFSYGFNADAIIHASSTRAVPTGYDILVLKLHGSVNWANETDDESKLTLYKNYADVQKKGLAPKLLPPTWSKVFSKELAQVWQKAVAVLTQATRVIVIGFSIPATDLHFKYLIAAGLSRNISLRQIVFVNPAADELKEKARQMLRPQYIDRNLISFTPVRLDQLTATHDPRRAARILRQK